MKPRLSEVYKTIMKETCTKIEVATAVRIGSIYFLVSGIKENVLLAKRRIQNATCVHVVQSMSVPSSVLASLIGTGGKNLKALSIKTMTKILLPKKTENLEGECTISVSGDCEGVLMAVSEIEELCALKVSDISINDFADKKIGGPTYAAIGD